MSKSIPGASSKIRVVLADDHHMIRVALASFLAGEQDIEVVGEAEDTDSLFNIVKVVRPDVLIMDAHMPGQRVIETTRELLAQHKQLRILILSAYNRDEYVTGLLGAGAVGYLLKDDPPKTLANAVRAVNKGEQWLSPQVTTTLIRSATVRSRQVNHKLTQREAEVLYHMAKGCKNDEIAAMLNVAEQTIKNHVSNIFGKLGVGTRVEAVLYAIDQGLVHLES